MSNQRAIRQPIGKSHNIHYLIPFLMAAISSSIFFDATIDDAFISARYAENLAHGFGPVFNIGEPVEGFSNPLMVGLEAIGIWLGGEAIMLAKVIGILSLLLIIFLILPINPLWAYVGRPRSGAVLLVGLLSINSYMVFWSIAGLETVFYSLLLILGIFLLVRESKIGGYSSALAFSAAALTRPEGVAFFLVCTFVYVSWKLFHKEKALKLLKECVTRSIVFSVPLICYFAFRIHYFESYFPNTYYAKIGGHNLWSGLAYIQQGMVKPQYFLLTGLSLIALYRASGLLLTWLLLACGLTQSLFIVWSGGDWMPGYRFIVPALPMLFALSVIGFNAIRVNTAIYHALVLSLLLLYPLQIFHLFDMHEKHYWRTAHGLDTRISLGKWLGNLTDSNYLVASGDMGAFPHASKARFLDINGLVDKEIGLVMSLERKGDISRQEKQKRTVDYLLDKEPALFVLATKEKLDWTRCFSAVLSEKAISDTLLLDERFIEGYTCRGVLVAYVEGRVAGFEQGRYLIFFEANGNPLQGLSDQISAINHDFLAQHGVQ